MNFSIDNEPPAAEFIDQERNILLDNIKRLTFRDTVVTFIIIAFCSLVLGLIVYWQTGNLRYTGISIAVFPVIGTLLSILGITKSTGFRSAANSISQLQNDLAELSPIANASLKDVDTLVARHKSVREYHEKLLEQDRQTLNGELAMYWEFDSSTMANTARGRDLVNKARGSIAS